MGLKRHPKLRTVARLALFLATLAVIAAISARPAASALGHWLVLDKADFARVDAIVLLGGSVPDRTLEARDLFRQKRAPRIVLVRERRQRELVELDKLGIHLLGDCNLNRLVLEKQGILPESIEEAPGDVDSTWEEALAFSKYAVRQRLKSAVIVTSKYHSRRSYLNFERACRPHGIKVYVIPSKYDDFDPSGWWKQRDDLKLAYFEFAKLVAYYLGFR